LKNSIRKFLLVYLLLAIGITTTLTAVGNYYLNKQDIQEHFDTIMAVSGLSYEALLADHPKERHLKKIQSALEGVPDKIGVYYPPVDPTKPLLEDYINRLTFQYWSSDNQRLLYTPEAPDLELDSIPDGFSNAWINNQEWRVFTATNHASGAKFILSEQYDTRNELRTRIAQDDLYIMLITFPLSGLLIWIVIGRGLKSLDKVANEVAHRAPSHLEPVKVEDAPEEIKPIIDELNKLFFRLQEGFEREKRFAADAAHELKTPLAVIKTQAQVALKATKKAEKNEAIDKIISGIDRTTHIVQQLLTMSQLVPDAEHISGFEQVDLVKVTRDMVATLAPKAIEKHIELEFESGKKLPKLHGNTTAICILVRNLVDNAISYTPSKGEVSVKIYKSDNHMMLEVSDNGPGISKNLHKRVFERFYRVVGNKAPGSGLGLAIAKQIVDLHRGSIKLSKPAKHSGLIVTIHFPYKL